MHSEDVSKRSISSTKYLGGIRWNCQEAPPKHFFQRSEHGIENLAATHGEFLILLTGSPTDRHGRPKSPREFQDGLTAEALRYLDLLLWKPISFDLNTIEELKVGGELQVQLPGLGAYVVQKALCSEKRKRLEKRDKDLAYLFDVATLTHRRWPKLREEVDDLRNKSSEWGKWVYRAAAILDDAFGSESAFGPSVVERIYEEGSVRASTVQRVMQQFIRAIGLTPPK
jgi:hypothetical protein